MSTTLQPGRRTSSKPVPFSRLLHAELRKLFDTRSGRWLVIVALAITVIALVITLFVVDAEAQNFRLFFGVMGTPISIFLPVLGVLTVTSEWSQRTMLVTFTHEPRRGRIIAAKISAALVAAFGTVIGALALAAVVNLVAMLFGADGDWTIEAGYLGIWTLTALSNVLFGVGLGMLLLNTPTAIVLFFVVLFVLPTAWGALGFFWSPGHTIASWVDYMWTSSALVEGPLAAGEMDPMTGLESEGDSWAQLWARFGVANAIWVALPLVIGAVRIQRSEVK